MKCLIFASVLVLFPVSTLAQGTDTPALPKNPSPASAVTVRFNPKSAFPTDAYVARGTAVLFKGTIQRCNDVTFFLRDGTEIKKVKTSHDQWQILWNSSEASLPNSRINLSWKTGLSSENRYASIIFHLLDTKPVETICDRLPRAVNEPMHLEVRSTGEVKAASAELWIDEHPTTVRYPDLSSITVDLSAIEPGYHSVNLLVRTAEGSILPTDTFLLDLSPCIELVSVRRDRTIKKRAGDTPYENFAVTLKEGIVPAKVEIFVDSVCVKTTEQPPFDRVLVDDINLHPGKNDCCAVVTTTAGKRYSSPEMTVHIPKISETVPDDASDRDFLDSEDYSVALAEKVRLYNQLFYKVRQFYGADIYQIKPETAALLASNVRGNAPSAAASTALSEQDAKRMMNQVVDLRHDIVGDAQCEALYEEYGDPLINPRTNDRLYLFCFFKKK